MNGSPALRLEDAHMAAFWTRQRTQWNLYPGELGMETPDTGLEVAESIVWRPVPGRSTPLLQKLALLLTKDWGRRA